MGPNISTVAAAKRHRGDELFRSKRLKQTDLETASADVSTGAVKDLRSRRIFSPVDSTGLVLDIINNNNKQNNSKLCDTKEVAKIETVLKSPHKSVTKSSLPKKVFKIAGSHNYRKLLPFLMDMNRDDTCTFSVSPCTPKTEKFDLGLQDKGDCSEGLKAVETEEMKNHDSELFHEAQNMDELHLSTIVGETTVHEDLKGSNDISSSNGVDVSTEGHGVSKTDDTNLGISSNSMDSNNTNPKFTSIVNGTKGEDENALCFKPFETGNIKKCITLLSCEVPHMNQLNLSGSDEGIQSDKQDQKLNKNGGSPNEFEENIQTTPPHMEIFSNPEAIIVENEENPKSSIVVENDGFSCEYTHKNICLKKSAIFKKKLVLNPCSRGKVFKAPGSFSYRRLLPYLKDVSNNYSYSSEVPSHRTVAIDIEENKTKTNLPMVEDLSSKLTPMKKSETNNQNLVSAEKSIEVLKPFDSPNIGAVPVEQIISSIIVDLEHAYGGEKSKTEATSSPILSRSSGDNETLYRDDAHSKSGRGTEVPDSVFLGQKSSQIDNSRSFEIPVNSKGILRRNPRGCRGLCNCLNCTSFRLNADRAFEFSRNQMLDSEEVALNLINELSGLRNLLKESSMNSHGQVTANTNQVMEACTKALKAEESAIYRLKEMRCDLTAHCRSKFLERPSVKFANHINEKVIPRVDLPPSDKNSKQEMRN